MARDAVFFYTQILAKLNGVLHGQIGGFVTCVVLHVGPNGETTIANAGHLPPYLNGTEVAIAGSLPLGMTESAEFPQLCITLQPGDRLTVMTDGVVEGQNERRELFGFTRTHELIQQDKSAIEIAAAAQSFGEEDDITVIRVVRAMEIIHPKHDVLANTTETVL